MKRSLGWLAALALVVLGSRTIAYALSPSPLAAEGIPFVFDRFVFLGFGRDYEPTSRVEAVRRREIPIDDAVVHFPAPSGGS